MTTTGTLVSFPSNVTLDELWEANLDDILGPAVTRDLQHPEPEPAEVARGCVCECLFSVADICSIARSSDAFFNFNYF